MRNWAMFFLEIPEHFKDCKKNQYSYTMGFCKMAIQTPDFSNLMIFSIKHVPHIVEMHVNLCKKWWKILQEFQFWGFDNDYVKMNCFAASFWKFREFLEILIYISQIAKFMGPMLAP